MNFWPIFMFKFVLFFQRPYPTNAQYGYNNWSPPAQSNETSNGQFLERSHSARITLAKAFDLCLDEVIIFYHLIF